MKTYKYEIFTTKIERAIRQGHLQAGDALPSVRETKAKYQLSTSSVQSGYDYLVFKGLVTSIPRSGYVVAAHIKTTTGTKLDLPTIPKDAVFISKNALTTQRLVHTETSFFSHCCTSINLYSTTTYFKNHADRYSRKRRFLAAILPQYRL
ncbi:winged helix-turn-helix domain-containing protein [Myroides sp. mNGS23_01]|nr:winged helix-turn-helix domain-containing protein [Myroides sp. mNGS23_01]WHT38557.1 winged helix-turn-helix domain-containing protein [Myroides sp. mNGS23_01]